MRRSARKIADRAPSPLADRLSSPALGGQRRMPSLEELLGAFTRVRGVTAAVLAGSDGLVLHSAMRPDAEVDGDAIGAVASSGILPAQELGQEVGRGRLVQSVLEYEKGVVLLEPIDDAAILAVVANHAANLGVVRLTVRRLRSQILA